MSKTFTLTRNNFSAAVRQATRPAVVEYGAPWCPSCRRLDPVIDRLADRYAESVTVGRVNIDDEPELAEQAGVRGIPYVVLYVNGVAVAHTAGAQSLESLEQALALDGYTNRAGGWINPTSGADHTVAAA